jgi:plasmid replication initiation protein
MASLVDNVAKVVAANAAIKDALAAKGVDVTDYTKLSQAAEKIAAIETGGGGVEVEEATGYLYVETPKEYLEY